MTFQSTHVVDLNRSHLYRRCALIHDVPFNWLNSVWVKVMPSQPELLLGFIALLGLTPCHSIDWCRLTLHLEMIDRWIACFNGSEHGLLCDLRHLKHRFEEFSDWTTVSLFCQFWVFCSLLLYSRFQSFIIASILEGQNLIPIQDGRTGTILVFLYCIVLFESIDIFLHLLDTWIVAVSLISRPHPARRRLRLLLLFTSIIWSRMHHLSLLI